MTITYIKHPAYLLINLAIFLFSACSEDDNYAPGTAIPMVAKPLEIIQVFGS